MPDTTVDIYCRASSFPPEDNINLNDQETACRQYCEANGLIISATYRDISSGYQYRDRMMLELMRLHYRKERINGVVVSSLDRLSRSHIHLVILLQEMAKYHITFYVVQEPLEETVAGRLLLTLLSFVAELEQEKSLDKLLDK